MAQLVWVNPTTLYILYAGSLPNFGAKRVDLVDRYFMTPGNMFIPVGSGYAFNYADPNGGGGGLNNPPTIVAINIDSSPGGLNKPITFEAIAVDQDGDTVSFAWNFGDTTGTLGNNVSHLYTAPGTYTVTLMATDTKGAVTQTTRIITIVDGPPPDIIATTPSDGVTVQYRLAAADCNFQCGHEHGENQRR